MAWTGLALTVDGRNALNEAQLLGTMKIKAVVVGDGNPPANFSTQKELVNQLYAITEIKVDKTESGCNVTVDFPKVGYDYYFREIGIIIDTDQGEKLYVYDNCGDDAQYIVSTTGVETTRKRIRLALNIADVAEITVINPSILYVAYDDFEQVTEEIKEFEKRNEENLAEHMSDKSNPHNVNKEQLGLEKVDNTADMDKPISAAQQTALNELYQQMTSFTLQKIADLINGAPESRDTLKEVSDAIAANKTIMDALDAAIGKKANQAEMDSLLGTKLDKTGDASNVTTAFTQAATRANLTTKEKLTVSMGKIMKWFADLANGAASTLLGVNLTANRALVANASGKIGVSSVTSTELEYLAGTKSKVQDQLDSLNTGLAGKAASSHTHDDRYYTETEVNTKLAGKANNSHTHDDRYYTETEIDAKLGGAHFACYQWIGWGITMIGTAMAYHIGNGTYMVKVQGTIINGSTTDDQFDWGINLTAIRSYAKIPTGQNCIGQWAAYRDGVLMQDFTGYGTAFALRTSGTGYDYLVPSRYYDASESFGWWGHREAIAKPGIFWDATIILW